MLSLEAKVTVWKRVNVKTKNKKLLKSLIKNGLDFDEIMKEMFDRDISTVVETLHCTEEPLMPDDNMGESTIELYTGHDRNKSSICSNGQ